MQNYEQAVGYIRNFLVENHYGQTLVKANERCFRTFRAYLNQEGTDYTPAKTDEWFHTYEGQLPVTDLDHYKMALLRQDIYECGDIRPEHNPKRQISYTVLTVRQRALTILAFTVVSCGIKPVEQLCYGHAV